MEIFFNKFNKIIHELWFIFKQNAKVQKIVSKKENKI